MNALKRWLVRRFGRRAEPYLKAHGLFQTVKYKPGLVWEPGAARVLVLAPHMDDEVIGCGGALLKHVRSGGEATVVYVTDGRSGSGALRFLAGEERRRGESDLVETRKREARLALQTLGVHEGIFLDAQEGALDSNAEVRQEVRRILSSLAPDLVYVPSFLEEHPDHVATARILLDASAGQGLRFDCCAYEVWTPLFPNCLVPIDDVLELKRRALEHYRSQLADNDYVHSTLGLNAYRSMALSASVGRFAEAFFMGPIALHRELYDSYRTLLGGVPRAGASPGGGRRGADRRQVLGGDPHEG